MDLIINIEKILLNTKSQHLKYVWLYFFILIFTLLFQIVQITIKTP